MYGLGFSSEAELNKFIEKFHEVKEATRTATNGTIDIAHAPSFGLLSIMYAVIPVIRTTLSMLKRKNQVLLKYRTAFHRIQFEMKDKIYQQKI